MPVILSYKHFTFKVMGVELDNGTDEEQRKRAELTRGFKVTPYFPKAQMAFGQKVWWKKCIDNNNKILQ